MAYCGSCLLFIWIPIKKIIFLTKLNNISSLILSHISIWWIFSRFSRIFFLLKTEQIHIDGKDYSDLSKKTYINDQIIDFYNQYLLKEKVAVQGRIHIFPGQFYEVLKTCLIEQDAQMMYNQIIEIFGNINILEKDLVLIPIKENEHWFLAVIWYHSKILIFDSMGFLHNDVSPSIFFYFFIF